MTNDSAPVDHPLFAAAAEAGDGGMAGADGAGGGEGHASGPDRRRVGLLSFAVQALIWGGLIWMTAREFAVGDFWVVALGVLVFSLPVALSGYYGATIRQIRRLTFFSGRGVIYRIFSRRVFRGIFWACWALAASFFMLIQFHTYTRLEWAAFFLVIPVFWAVFSLSRRLIAREVKPFLVTAMALSWARKCTPLIMLVIYTGLLLLLGDYPGYESLEQALADRQTRVADMTGSALVFEASHYLAWYDGARAYFLGRIGGEGALPAAGILGLAGLVVFFNACAMLSCFLIPAVEYRRIFGPLTESEVPPPVTPRRLAMIAAVFTFASIFIYLPAFTALEALLHQNREVVRAREMMEAKVLPRLEQIDRQFFQPGTIDRLARTRLEALRQVEAAAARVEAQIEQAFDRVEDNVGAYLDWYYSLPAEYMRIGNLLLGQLEDYMIGKLKEILLRGEPFRQVEAALDQAIAAHEGALREYQAAVRRIMEENRVEQPEDGVFKVVQRVSLEEVLNPELHSDVIGFSTRLGGGGAAAGVSGVVTAVVIKKIVAKVVAKNTFKVAVKSLAKVVAGKAAGTAGGAAVGAAAGAAVGSVLPGVGTAAGAIIGGVIGGVAVGVSVDKMLLLLESAISREDFKAEILTAVREAREETLANLRQ